MATYGLCNNFLELIYHRKKLKYKVKDTGRRKMWEVGDVQLSHIGRTLDKLAWDKPYMNWDWDNIFQI